MNETNFQRRRLLQALTAGGLVAGLDGFSLHNGLAQTAPASDYKALVCIFMAGGNDGNNMVIPADNAGYGLYESVRPASSGINIPQADLLTFQPSNVSTRFGFNPALAGIHPLFEQGKLAVLANVGTLLSPITKAQYANTATRPYSLFSHSDQVAQWHTAESDGPVATGWGGRMADAVAVQNGSVPFPVTTSVAGATLFVTGNAQDPLAIPSSGTFGLSGLTGTDTATRARLTALNNLLKLDKDHQLIKAAGEGTEAAITLANTVNPIISASTSPVVSLFNVTGNGLAQQLMQVAKLIEARATIGLKRQIFYVQIGSFDTHTNQAVTQGISLSAQGTNQNLLSQVGNAMKSFYDATALLGVADKVTTFTMTDFGRTFKPAAGAGSDHAWGNHHLIMGGAVKGGAMYGKFPTLQLSGPDDVASEGRWLPTTAVDQYAATLASWFGVASGDLTKVLPNVGAFATRNLGFMA